MMSGTAGEARLKTSQVNHWVGGNQSEWPA